MLKKLAEVEPVPPWGFFMAIATIIAMFVTLVIGTTISQVVLGESTPTGLLIGWNIGMALTIIYVRFSLLRTPEEQTAMGLDITAVRWPVVALFALGMVILFDLLSQAVTGQFELTTFELRNLRQAETSLVGWINALLLMILLQPVAEELVFRGIVYPVVRSAFGAWMGLVMCAAFSAVFHFAAYTSAGDNQTVLIWYGLMLPFLNALVFSGVRAYTRSTRAAIVAHAMFGVFAVFKVFIIAG